MRIVLLLLTSLFLHAVSYGAESGSKSTLLHDLKTVPRQLEPHWKGKIEERFPSGQPVRVVYHEEVGKSPPTPVKIVTFYPHGQIKQEVDVTSIQNENGETITVPHGVELNVDERGKLEKVAQYAWGELDGEMKLFFPTGQVKAHSHFKRGKREGSSVLYFLDGSKAEEFQYADDKIIGEYVRYYPREEGGGRFMAIPYNDGMPHGNAMEWYPSGSIRRVTHYEAGVLNSDEKSPAVVIRAEDYTLSEIQDYRQGELVGAHIKYHSNGREAYKVSYKNGKKEGKEIFLSFDGKILGEGEYREGIPFGKHWRNHENGAMAFLALFDEKGVLLGPIEEWGEDGVRLAHYFLKEGKLDGPFKQWYEDKKLKSEFHYEDGEFEGPQREYYPSSQVKSQAFYQNKKREGEHLEWYEDGRPALKISFKNGEKEGETISWYSNGQKKFEEYILNGKAHGKRTEWYGNGVVKSEEFFSDGLKEGVHREFNEQGDPIVEVHYKNDNPHGAIHAWYGKNKLKHSIYFVEGKKEGVEEYFYPNGGMKSRAYYKEGLIDGKLEAFFEDGTIRLEQYFVKGFPVGDHREFYSKEEGGGQLSGVLHYDQKSRLQGKAETFYPNGRIQSVKEYKDDEFHGKSASWDEEGNLLVEIDYKNGKMNGRFFKKLEDGKEIVYHYKDNQRHGLHTIYYSSDDGVNKQRAFEVTFVEGVSEGEAVEYDEKGNKISCTPYVKGLKEGLCQIFDKGRLLMQVSFKKDKREGMTREYYPKGTLLGEVGYKDNQKHGEEKGYFEDGTPAHYAQYIDGKLDGPSYRWNDKGILIFEGEYKDGLRQGKFNKYYDDGSPKVLQNFINDQLCGIKKSYDAKGICSESRWNNGKRGG